MHIFQNDILVLPKSPGKNANSCRKTFVGCKGGGSTRNIANHLRQPNPRQLTLVHIGAHLPKPAIGAHLRKPQRWWVIYLRTQQRESWPNMRSRGIPAPLCKQRRNVPAQAAKEQNCCFVKLAKHMVGRESASLSNPLVCGVVGGCLFLMSPTLCRVVQGHEKT